MDTIKFLEKLATNAHHQFNFAQIIGQLPDNISGAYITNDSEVLKSFYAGNDYMANEVHVIQF